MKRWLSILTTVGVTIGVSIYAFWDVDLPRLGSLLTGGAYWVLAPFWGLLFLFYLLTAVRWGIILSPVQRFVVAELAPAVLVGAAGNNLLPARMGELLRAVVFALRFRLSTSGVLATVVLERLLDILAILFFYFVAVFTIRPFPDSLRLGLGPTIIGVGSVIAAIMVFLRWPLWFDALWQRISRPLPASLRSRGNKLVHNVAAGLSALKSTKLVAQMVLHSCLKWLACAAMVWLSLYSYGVLVPIGVALVVVAVTALALTLPNVPGFFGMMQAAFVLALTPFDVSREAALAASVLFLFAQYVPVTLAGVFLFVSTGLKLSDVRREMKEGTLADG